jgi:hypothetical protein
MKSCGILWVFTVLLFVNVLLFFAQQPFVRQPPFVRQQPFVRQPPPQQPFVRQPPPQQPFVRPAEYSVVGYLETVTQGMVPLYARPSPTHRHRHNYYTRNSNEYLVRLPVIKDGRDCTNNLGCDELYDKDVVTVPGIPDPLTVHMYSKEF